jgi:hypothetical protein
MASPDSELRKKSVERRFHMAGSVPHVLIVVLLGLLCLSPERQAAAGPIDITVLTQNLYLGANTDPLFAAKTLPELQTAIVNAANSVQPPTSLCAPQPLPPKLRKPGARC